jgi:hypothetical protein
MSNTSFAIQIFNICRKLRGTDQDNQDKLMCDIKQIGESTSTSLSYNVQNTGCYLTSFIKQVHKG